jgi:hypothetical protein
MNDLSFSHFLPVIRGRIFLISSPVTRGRIKEGESRKDDLSREEIMI